MPLVPSTWHPTDDVEKEKMEVDEKPDTKEDVVGFKRRIFYFHNENVSDFHYGVNHPMKPQRLAACHSLVVNYGLHHFMTCIEPPPATFEQLATFHAPDYLEYLKTSTPQNIYDNEYLLAKFNIGEDCPLFDGVYDFCTYYAGGSIEGARAINCGFADIAINWAGGLHHAKKAEPSGFCYVNDIVIGILELLKHNQRVLYIDIDIHHGDGVQEAFYWTDRVMTVSFHRYGSNFFPGTGDKDDIGKGVGKYYSVNVPLREGIDDNNYRQLFQPIIKAVCENYDPNVIVLQCGSDSLGADRLGSFNLSFNGHGDCVRFVKSLGRPVMTLGGGGYTLRNVARCWANETAIIVGQDDVISPTIPETSEYREFFAAEQFKLKPDLTRKYENQNTKEYLEYLRMETVENLRGLKYAPSVQLQPEHFFEESFIEYMRNPKKLKSKKYKKEPPRDG